jgi:hypothetical protein
MSVSIHFQAIIPIDGDTYRKHKAVVDACKAAGVSVPAAFLAFFDDGGRDCDRQVTELGVLVGIDYGRVRAVEGDVMVGPEAIIDLSKLPPGTTKIRVYAG